MLNKNQINFHAAHLKYLNSGVALEIRARECVCEYASVLKGVFQILIICIMKSTSDVLMHYFMRVVFFTILSKRVHFVSSWH